MSIDELSRKIIAWSLSDLKGGTRKSKVTRMASEVDNEMKIPNLYVNIQDNQNRWRRKIHLTTSYDFY